MRLFVAITPPPAAIDSIALALAPLRESLPGARWVDPGRWHVTLRFLGDTGPTLVPALISALDAVSAQRPMTLALAGTGTFPLRGRPSVLWVGLAGELDRLAAVTEAVDRAVDGAVEQAGVTSARDQPFHPHLTVARFRRPAGPARSVVLGLADVQSEPFSTDTVRLVRSHRGGPYETLHETRLGPGPVG